MWSMSLGQSRTHPAELADAVESVEAQSRAERAATTAELFAELSTATSAEQRRELVARIVLVNHGVAVAMAMRYRNRGVPLDDLCQTAFEGLTKAVQRFDPELSSDLLTYAVPTIRGELQRHFRDTTWMVRPPRRVQELQRQVNQRIDELCQTLGHEPNRAELAEHLDLSEAEVDEAQLAHDCFSMVSLDQPVTSEAGLRLADVLREPDDTDLTEARMALAPVVRRLPERDRRILYLRFFEDRTQAEIGKDLGVSQMQVSRLLTKLLDQLRAEIS